MKLFAALTVVIVFGLILFDSRNDQTTSAPDKESLSQVLADSEKQPPTEYMKAIQDSPNVLMRLTDTGDAVVYNSYGTCSIVKLADFDKQLPMATRECEAAYKNHN